MSEQLPVIDSADGTTATTKVHRRIPEWLTIKVPRSRDTHRVENLMRTGRLVTVCEEARCPNLGECWSKGTATFMVMGDTCTRSCRFCAVKTGRGAPLEADEPARVADAAADLGLKHVVVTSVNRDDIYDGGASHIAAVIEALREQARATLGDRFDIRGFHDAVLGGGAMPLDLLEKRVDLWIAAKKAG